MSAGAASKRRHRSTRSYDEWFLRSREIAITVRRIADLVVGELSFRGRLSLGDRMRLWRRGMGSASAELYGAGEVASGNYLSDSARAIRTPKINGRYAQLLDNKLAFTYMIECLKPGAMARLVGIILRGDLTIVDPRWRLVREQDDVADYVLDTVIKPVEGTLGKGIHFLTHGSSGQLRLDGQEVSRVHVAELVRSLRAHVVTEFVDQAEYARGIYPRTTNTIRMLTLRCPDTGEILVPVAVHRFGTKRSRTIDTWHGGGLGAVVDLASGILGMAVGAAGGAGPDWVSHHPDTGMPIEGVEVPHWPDVMREITGLASRVPFLPYIGWDVVVTDEGFRILEGNNRSDIDFLQAHTPLLRDLRVRRFFEHHGVVSTRPPSRV